MFLNLRFKSCFMHILKENPKKQSEIVGVVSCMFAGKTSYLIKFWKDVEYAGKSSMVFRAEPDATRFGASDVVTHSGEKIPSTIFKYSSEILENIDLFVRENNHYPDSVFIIEAPFTDSGLVNVVNEVALNMGINVFYDGLNMTSEGDAFPFILDPAENQKTIGALIECSDRIYSPTAVCIEASRRNEPKTDATRTQWKHWIYGPKTKALDVGGKEKYEARSVRHWQSRCYDDLFSEVIENADLGGIIEGYVLDVSRTPASLLTVFKHGEKHYSRFASLRDMVLTNEGYQKMKNASNFIPERSGATLKPNHVSFMFEKDRIVTDRLDHVLDSLDEYARGSLDTLDKNEREYVIKEIERSYLPLRNK